MSLGRCIKLLIFAGLFWWAFKLGENHLLTTHGVAPAVAAKSL